MASTARRPTDAYSPRLDINPQSRHNFFAQPQTPLTSTGRSYVAPSTLSVDSTPISHSPNPSNTSRKRPRYDRTNSVAYSTDRTPYSMDNMSPAPLANIQYRLADGLDTPTAASQVSLRDNVTPEDSFRRGRSYGQANEQRDYFHNYAGDNIAKLPGRIRNGLAPLAARDATVTTTTWGSMVFGLAGRVWDFCTGNFRGFHAGGGQGYSLENSRPIPTPPPQIQRMESSSWIDIDTDNDGRTSKKSKTSHASDLRDSWVMIDSPTRNFSREPSPSISTRRTAAPRLSTASSALARSTHPITSRPSLDLRRTSTIQSSRPASSAGLRSPHVTSPQFRPSHKRSSSSNAITNDKEKIRRQSNIARPITPNRSPTENTPKPSPIVKQTAQYLENQRRREAKEEREFQKLNQRLEHMIRQGKEALGTRVEVEVWSDGDEEGDAAGMPGGW
ncbi:hypothetical protein MMC10_005428 [Thelotrema lepadinum]|nr:hypothetical protein [Thelotrema lepadinum]